MSTRFQSLEISGEPLSEREVGLDDDLWLVNEYHRIGTAITQLEKQRDELKEQIKLRLADGEVLGTDTHFFSLIDVARKGWDEKVLIRLLTDEQLETARTSTTSQQLRWVKK